MFKNDRVNWILGEGKLPAVSYPTLTNSRNFTFQYSPSYLHFTRRREVSVVNGVY